MEYWGGARIRTQYSNNLIHFLFDPLTAGRRAALALLGKSQIGVRDAFAVNHLLRFDVVNQFRRRYALPPGTDE